MSDPSLIECIYESVLDFVKDISDLASRTQDIGTTIVHEVQEAEQEPSSFISRWTPKVSTSGGQAPLALTRGAVLGTLRGGCINFVRLGGISGFVAVAISAYAAHAFAKGGGGDEDDEGGDDGDNESRPASSQKTRASSRQSTKTGKSTKSRSHVSNENDEDDEDGNGKEFSDADKQIFYTANLFHFVHSLALLATPVYKCPNLTGLMFTAGMALFCGSCYIRVFTGNKDVSALTPYGGVLLLVGWLTLIF